MVEIPVNDLTPLIETSLLCCAMIRSFPIVTGFYINRCMHMFLEVFSFNCLIGLKHVTSFVSNLDFRTFPTLVFPFHMQGEDRSEANIN